MPRRQTRRRKIRHLNKTPTISVSKIKTPLRKTPLRKTPSRKTPSRKTINQISTITPVNISRPPNNDTYDRPTIFFDNDIHITSGLEEKCNNIVTIKVYESQFTTQIKSIDENILPPDFRKNPAYFYYKSILDLAELPIDIYGGLQQMDMEKIEKWLADSHNYRERTAIFDFDRTISIIDGFDPTAEIRGKFSEKEHMEFLCGGQQRIEWLQNFFKLLQNNDIKIKICTNNPGCSADRMIQFMRVLDVFLENNDIICAVVENDKDENLINSNIDNSSKYKITALKKRNFC